MDKHAPHQPPRASGPAHGSNYWQLLEAAADALDVGDFPAAERRYRDACDLREASPGRVFITEKIGDGVRRLFSRNAPAQPASIQAGRWPRASRAFVSRFVAEGEKVVREGVRRAELRPEDDAEANQPILESALFLVARSRLFQDEPASAIPLLKGLFRTAFRTGRPFSVDLVRHDLPLTEEDRLWMARKGGELVDSFVEQGHLRPGGPEAEEWAAVFLQLLQARYFGATGRLEEERAWLEAVTADRLLVRGAASVSLYRAYLDVNPEPGPRPDEARVRLLELLGNIQGLHFPVPRYREALGTMQSAGLAAGSILGGRFQSAIARLEYRRPEPDSPGDTAPAWASAALEPDGRVAIVYWWDNEPRDLAFWSAGDDPAALDEFLAPCEGRLLAADEATLAAVGRAWAAVPAPWTAADFVAAILESRLPAGGLDPAALLRLALAETGPWRAGWRADLGHGLLEPPHSSSLVEAWQKGTAAAALQAGLLFLAVRSRVAAADMSLRAGIGEMARRGDAAAAFLYGFLVLDSAAERALDASFEAWTLPLLWTRPDPFGWSGGAGAAGLPESGLRPDLGRSDLTIVTTGNAAEVLAAWGDGKQKWRVVLDRMDRLESLSRVAGTVVGPVTLIPPGGAVHSLPAALDLLEELLAQRRDGPDGLLALFHWTRLVETHNGDLLDFRQVRPRAAGAVPLHDRYSRVAGALPTEPPSLATAGGPGADALATWSGQFSQRVRKAGLVAGTAAQLATDPVALDSLWGVFEGSDAAWVFLDSAAVHWTLHRQGRIGIEELHDLLHSRGGRHLSLLSAAAWQRTELEELLATWLQVYGSAYCLSLTDTRAPVLRLADRGVQPDARWLAADEFAGQVTWIDRRFAEEGPGTVRLPARGRPAEFWRQVRAGELGLAGGGWHFMVDDDDPRGLPPGALVVPVLHSLEAVAMPVAANDSRAAWAQADAERLSFLTWRRQLCALEIAALMAGPWRSVDVLDTRWWRLLRPLAVAGRPADAARRARPWDGEQAALLATGGQARTFDLPRGGADRAVEAVDGRVLELVRGWLVRRADTAAPAAVVAPPPPGIRLLIGDLSALWEGLAAHLASGWERGRTDQWALLVADAMPPGAADLVAAAQVAGLSVWRGGPVQADPAPILWVEPEDFADPDLRRLLAVRPPAFVIADDLSDWLPGSAWDAQETAQALRAILDLAADSVTLRARELTPSWAGFLGQACAATVVAGAGGDGPTAAGTEPPPWPAPGPCLDCGHADRPAACAHRLQTLLARLRTVLQVVAGGDGEGAAAPLPPAGQQLLPLDWLGRLAGLSGEQVGEGVLLLRWAARLNGDSLSAAGGAGGGGGHTLLIARRFAELETVLARLAEDLAVLLPLWLDGATVPGLLNRIDLEQPPVRIPAADLARVDAFLAAIAQAAGGTTGLVYHAPRGMLHSATRLIGWDGSSAELLPAVLDALDLFRARIRDVMGTALETGAGFRVETGLTELRDDERSFLSLGVVLGFWRWLGPAAPGAIHLVDLLTVADSPTVRQSPLGWDLFRAQMTPRLPDAPAVRPQVETGPPEGGPRSRLGPLRRLLSPGQEAVDDLAEAIARVHEVTRQAGDPTFLMLKGMLGTGRHEALARGLLRTRQQADDPGDVTIYCPDEAVAAMVAREFLQRGGGLPLDIRVPGRQDGLPTGPQNPPTLTDPGTAVIVMCEVQRFDPEIRYRVAQLGRGRLLVMTADAAASTEPWEHLFLTTPRANDIVTLARQRRLSKSIWTEVRALAPENLQAEPGTRRAERGHLESGYAANLVQSVARIVAAHEAGSLPDLVRLTAPLAADLDYAGAQLRDRGWLAVREAQLDPLLLPGPREVLAAVTDLLAGAGELAPRGGRAPVLAEAAAAGDADPPDVEPAASSAPYGEILPRLLGVGARPAAAAWCAGQVVDPDQTLAAFVGRLVGQPWANTFLRDRDARRRCERMLAGWGDETVRGVTESPLWEAWWQLTTRDLGRTGGAARRPLVLLAETARAQGARTPGGVYLCLGTEPARQHYEVLGRIADSGLVLFQERSPLPGEAPAP